jgi:hypothetical protein
MTYQMATFSHKSDCSFLRAVVRLGAVLTMVGLGLAPELQAQPAASPDISGFWELRYWSRNIPKASLTAAAAGADRKAQEEKEFHVIRWCNHVGVPFMMDDGSPIDIRQSRDEIAITSQSNSPVRHVYMNRADHPARDTFDPTTLGNSLGRWNGDTLIVDTVGFNDAGLNAIPGGGVRTENSHLVEQYKLADENRSLQVTFTWTDDKIFTMPHTYAFTYQKLPASTTAREWFCDPMDGMRARFLIDRPQAPR